jgi:hypothetical protein
MGVVALYFVDYVVEVCMVVEMLSGSYISSSLLLIVLFSIGCALSAPNGSSPRGYGWILVVNHRLKLTSSSSYFVSPRAQGRGFSYIV